MVELPSAVGTWLWRGFPDGIDGLPIRDVASRGWRSADLVTPVATLDRAALTHNQSALDAWLNHVGAEVAPHVKTTMSPELMRLQLDSGAWALTAANPWQGRVMAAAGATRVLIANEVSAAPELARLAAAVETWVFVDSPGTVGVVADAQARSGREIPVLLDVGFAHARSGVRTVDAGLAVAAACHDRGVRLAGYGLFEGVLAGGRSDRDLATIRAALDGAVAIIEAVHAAHPYEAAVVTGGGSMFPDVVAEVLGEAARGLGGRLVLRPGCYLVHDHGSYEASYRQHAWLDLRPALTVLASVVSVPEPGLALLDAGKRDLSLDGRTAPVIAVTRGDAEIEHPELAVTRSNDQHSYLEWDSSAWEGLRVGDRVRLGVSHPCVTFQLWRAMPLVEHDAVVGVVRTFF